MSTGSKHQAQSIRCIGRTNFYVALDFAVACYVKACCLITAPCADVEGYLVGTNNFSVFNNACSVVETHDVVLAAVLVRTVNSHVLQCKVRVVLDDAHDVLGGINCLCEVFLRDVDRTVLEHYRRILQKLEAVGLGACRACTRLVERIGVAIEVNCEVLSRGNRHAAGIGNVSKHQDGLTVLDGGNSLLQRLVLLCILTFTNLGNIGNFLYSPCTVIFNGFKTFCQICGWVRIECATRNFKCVPTLVQNVFARTGSTLHIVKRDSIAFT